MRRGEIWTVAGGPDYIGKPRPAVIVQSDAFDATNSITICALTTDAAELRITRPIVAPSIGNGLRQSSRLMIDKLSTLPKSKLGARIGRLDAEDMARLERAIIVFLGLAG